MLANIQVLRALAALMVATAHLQPLFAAVHPTLAAVGFGRAGVDLFFVISGVIMVRTTVAEPPEPGRFALRRLLRIGPLYWLVTLFVFAVAVVRPGLLDAGRPDPVWLLKSLTFIPFDKGDGTTNPLLPVGWTLNYEMFFYALLAVALIPPIGRARYALLAGLIAALAAPGFFVRFDHVLLDFYTRPILVEFALGLLLGLAFERLPRLAGHGAALGVAAGAGGLAALLASGLAAQEAVRVLVAAPAATVVVAAALALDRGGASLRNPALLFLGDASYAIYLTHLFVTQAFVFAASALAVGGAAAAVAWIVLAYGAIIGVAAVAYLGFERPIHRLARARLRARPPTAALGVAP